MGLVIAGENLYTIKEIAETLKVSVQAVRKWIKAGKMPARRIGRPIYISETDLKTYLNNSELKSDDDKSKKLEVRIYK